MGLSKMWSEERDVFRMENNTTGYLKVSRKESRHLIQLRVGHEGSGSCNSLVLERADAEALLVALSDMINSMAGEKTQGRKAR